MSGFQVKGEITGLGDVLGRLLELKRGLRNRILRKALGAGGKPIIRLMKLNVPVRLGQMKKSLGTILRTYTSGVVALVMGARKGFRIEHPDRPGEYVDPTKYLHLVLFGRKAVQAQPGKELADGAEFFGTEAGPVAGDNFFQRAWDEMIGTSVAEIRRVVFEELAKAGR